MDPQKPIAVSTGMTVLTTAATASAAVGIHSMTSTGGGGEAEHEQLAPVSALAHRYVGAPYTTRQVDLSPESVPYRLVGVVDGTTLTFDPPIAGVPSTVGLGQVADFESQAPFLVQSQDAQHPFYFAEMMAGGKVTKYVRPGATDPPPPGSWTLAKGLGDEDFVTLVPPAQFLNSYVFYTDPTFATTTLTLIRAKGQTGFQDVTVECLGTVKGWRPVGSGGEFEVSDFDLVRFFKPVGSCLYGGLQRASSPAPFGILVWGTDLWSSYGYAGGGNLATLNNVVIP
jgi:hypothetical protein